MQIFRGTKLTFIFLSCIFSIYNRASGMLHIKVENKTPFVLTVAEPVKNFCHNTYYTAYNYQQVQPNQITYFSIPKVGNIFPPIKIIKSGTEQELLFTKKGTITITPDDTTPSLLAITTDQDNRKTLLRSH